MSRFAGFLCRLLAYSLNSAYLFLKSSQRRFRHTPGQFACFLGTTYSFFEGSY